MTDLSFPAALAIVAEERRALDADPDRPARLRQVAEAFNPRGSALVPVVVPAREPREIDTGVSWIRIRETASGSWRVRYWLGGTRHTPMVFPTEARAVAYVERLKARTAGAK